MNNVPSTPTAPAGGQEQNTNVSPDLNTAMDSWGEGDNPLQRQQTQQGGQQQTQQSSSGQQTQQQGLSQQGQQSAQGSLHQGQQQGQTTAAAQPDTTKLIEAAINSTAAAMQRAQQAARPPEPVKPMSDEEFAQRYGIVRYDAKTLERLFDKDPAKAAAVLNEINQNAYQAAVRMANDLTQAQLAQARNAYNPRLEAIEKFVAEQTERQATDRFYTAYPALKEESPLVQEILNAVSARVKSGELKFQDEAQAFKFVADATQTRIDAMRAKYGGNGTGANGGQQHPPQRQMAQATQSARPGAARPRNPTDMEQMMADWDARDRLAE